MDLTTSPRATPFFLRAGFDINRQVEVHGSVPATHPAHELLKSLGGLRIGVGADETMLEEVRNDIDFMYADRYGHIDEWERLLGTRLVGIAETHHHHGLLYLAEDERFFSLSGMHDAMGFEGTGFRTAIDNLLFSQSMPMIRPDQTTVRWYGIEYRHGDNGLYNDF
jgi:SUKH-3 immunity protein